MINESVRLPSPSLPGWMLRCAARAGALAAHSPPRTQLLPLRPPDCCRYPEQARPAGWRAGVT
eukprot:522527-Pleurochrysis_carterae.AAC.2